MKYKNKANGFVIDSAIVLSGVWVPADCAVKTTPMPSAASDTPDDTWKLIDLKDYAEALGVDATAEKSKKGVLALIEEAMK